MADTEQMRDAGRRLATDLRDLQEARKIETETILEATRLSADIFERFSETALVDHPAFNRVYLRSVVASYARVLQIDENDVLKALEDALEGTYDGALWRKYLRQEDGSDGPSFSLYEDDAPADPDSSDSDVYSGMHEALSTADESGAEKSLLRGLSSTAWIAIVVVAAVIAVWSISFLMGGDTDESTQENDVARDSVSVPVRAEPEWIVLGDSIRFDIVAVTEPLDPIRVKVDEDMRRPYWIEERDTLTFFVNGSISFERELDVADILMDGYLLSDSLIDENGRMVLTRDRAQAWLDSLAVRLAERQ